MLLPNTHSFLLTRDPIIESNSSVFLPSKHSFLLKRGGRTSGKENIGATVSVGDGGEQVKVGDPSKRDFLKVAGIAGAGLIASQLSPKKAEALILGS